MARHRAVIGAGALLTAVLVATPAADAEPCPKTKPPAQLLRGGYFVFEGVVVDRWNEIVVDPFEGPRRRPTLRTLRLYRFQVERSWTWVEGHGGVREVELTHGWYDGPRWSGRYPTYEIGERHLVFAASHDMPPHAFSSRCLPGATGDDIATLAGQLGPPKATYAMRPPTPAPFWQQPVRRAREYAQTLRALIIVAAAH
jgi:hypothetical protein